MRTPTVALALATALQILASAGCRGRGEPSPSIAVSDSAGVTIVTSAGEGMDRPLEVTLAAEPYLRIGTIDGGEETQFTSVLAAARLSDGRLLVAEWGDERVRLFSPDGRFLNWIGTVGEGPAEYVSVGGAGVLEGDTVWVHDRGRREFELFTPEGEFVRTFRPDRLSEAPLFRRSEMIRDGRVVDQGTTLDLGDVPAGTRELQEDVVISVMDREGRDAVAVTRGPGLTYQFGSGGGGDFMTFTAMYDTRFAARPLFAAGSDRIHRADPATFEIRDLSLEGALLKITRIRRARIPVRRSIINEYERRLAEAMESVPRLAAGGGVNQAIYADSLPHFESLKVDENGLLWVAEYAQHLFGPEPARWWRLGRDGGIDGYLDVPQGFRVLSIGREEVLGVVQDELDVPYVVAHRLVEGA